MLYSKSRMVVAAGLTAILSLGIAGCSFSSSHESTSTVSTSVTDENGVTETTETTTTNTDGDVQTTTDTSKTIDISSWDAAWMGETDGGQQAFFAQSPDASQGLFALYNPETTEIIGVVGDNSLNEDGDEVTTTDIFDGGTVTMVIREQDDDGTVIINFGSEYGDVTMSPVDMSDFIDQLAAVDVNGEILTK